MDEDSRQAKCVRFLSRQNFRKQLLLGYFALMKINLILILFIFFLSCHSNSSKEEIIEKAKRIRIELLNNKSLPDAFLKSHDEPKEPSDIMDFMYYSIRKANNLVDSVLMIAYVHKDSLERLYFQEMHEKNGKEDKSYVYSVNKYGAIEWAYRTNPPTSEPQKTITKKGTIMITPSNLPIIEINTDSAYTQVPFKKPDEKTLAMYIARLQASLDELDKMLFAK